MMTRMFKNVSSYLQEVKYRLSTKYHMISCASALPQEMVEGDVS